MVAVEYIVTSLPSAQRVHSLMSISVTLPPSTPGDCWLTYVLSSQAPFLLAVWHYTHPQLCLCPSCDALEALEGTHSLYPATLLSIQLAAWK